MTLGSLPNSNALLKPPVVQTRYTRSARASMSAGGVGAVLSMAAEFADRIYPVGRYEAIVASVLGLLMIGAGVGLSIVALTGIRKHGRAGILSPAIRGLLLSGAVGAAVVLMRLPAGLDILGRVATTGTLDQARAAHVTQLSREIREDYPVAEPPAGVLEVVDYGSPVGRMAAYITPAPRDGRKHPAIIWLVGGFSNSISEAAWEPSPAHNDQSARVFRDAGIVTMYPSLRGGNKNPGRKESFYGEVDDVLAAAACLANAEYVDPQRIYLGGHSTGGTLALLTAETPNRFRAVFAFGPVTDARDYGSEELAFDPNSRDEGRLRAPLLWMRGITCPTFVFEGADGRSNISALRQLERACTNPKVRFYAIGGADHFSALQRVSRLVAQKILDDDATSGGLVITPEEVDAAMRKPIIP